MVQNLFSVSVSIVSSEESCIFYMGIIYCSGHRIGTAEVESALVSHPHCAEAAVVGIEHEVGLLVIIC